MITDKIKENKTILGVEFGSTRIKAVLSLEGGQILATSDYGWENSLVDGLYTYDLEEAWTGLRHCYSTIYETVKKDYQTELTGLGALGFSGMMHGYLAFDREGELLAPFRTWRNTNTGEATEILRPLLKFNIPHRWTIAHLYQAILDNEDHLDRLDFLTSLSGYIHRTLTGEKVLGIGEASGLFPIDEKSLDYNQAMIDKFDKLSAEKGFGKKLRDLLPKVLVAGDAGGRLTRQGALLIDPTGRLQAGALLCPPEGDAGTGMVATNSIRPRTGNISAGTSIFSMLVLEKDLKNYYAEVDMVTTPAGRPVAMVHCNTCTSDLDAWVRLFHEFAQVSDPDIDIGQVYTLLYHKALEADADCGGLLAYNFYSDEPVVKTGGGFPLFIRKANADLRLANFMRAHLYSSFACLKLGMDLLLSEEDLAIDRLLGHGGLFKQKGIAQQFMADALNTRVEVNETASEGGAWGMAILAEYRLMKKEGQSLEDYLDDVIFKDNKSLAALPESEGRKGFLAFMENYEKGLELEDRASKIM